MNQYEISLYKLVAHNNPVAAIRLLHEYGEAPNKTYEDVEEGLRYLVRTYGDVALGKITAIHPHINLFQKFPEVLGLPEHKEEKPKEEPKKEESKKNDNEKFNACGCISADGQNTAATKPAPTTTTEKIFTPTNIAVVSIAVIAAIFTVAIINK